MNIFSNKYVQFLIVAIVIIGIMMVCGLTLNIKAGSAGFGCTLEHSSK